MAVEQETGRLLWRTYYPGVHVSFTTPAYHQRTAVSAAGRIGAMSPAVSRCGHGRVDLGSPVYRFAQLEPATAAAHSQRTDLLPVQYREVHRPRLAVRASEHVWLRRRSAAARAGPGTWRRATKCGRAISRSTGMAATTRACAWRMERSYYSCYFGNKPISGVTAALEPDTGKDQMGHHRLLGACGLHALRSIADDSTWAATMPWKAKSTACSVWTQRTGQLVWKSDPLERAIHVVTIADDRLFTHAQYQQGYLLDANQRCEALRADSRISLHAVHDGRIAPAWLEHGPD